MPSAYAHGYCSTAQKSAKNNRQSHIPPGSNLTLLPPPSSHRIRTIELQIHRGYMLQYCKHAKGALSPKLPTNFHKPLTRSNFRHSCLTAILDGSILRVGSNRKPMRRSMPHREAMPVWPQAFSTSLRGEADSATTTEAQQRMMHRSFDQFLPPNTMVAVPGEEMAKASPSWQATTAFGCKCFASLQQPSDAFQIMDGLNSHLGPASVEEYSCLFEVRIHTIW